MYRQCIEYDEKQGREIYDKDDDIVATNEGICSQIAIKGCCREERRRERKD